MPRIQPIDPATASGETVELLATARRMFGGTPNVVTTAAKAPSTLAAMLGMFAHVGKGTLSPQIGERIAIAVAQANGCGYCLSAHTVIGRLRGLGPAELAAARQAMSVTPKIAGILTLAVAINSSRGHVSDQVLAAAREVGVTDAEIVEVVGHVALNVLTNYLNSVSETVIDFPEIPLEPAA